MPASAPYIPPPDADFDAWLQNFATLIQANPTDYGLVAGDATAIDAVRDTWTTNYALAINPTTRTSVTIANKDVARFNAEAVCRPYAQQIRANDSVSDGLKTGLGLNLQPETLTPIPAPLSSPVMGLRGSTTGQSVIAYHDSVLTGKVKPYGAKGIDIHVGYSTTPLASPDDCAYLQTISKSPNTITWPVAQRGKIATIFARYRTQSGPAGNVQFGPWSEALSLTVT